LKGGSQALWTVSENYAPPIIPSRKLVGVVHGPLEYGAVNGALVALASPRDDGHGVAPLEPVVVAHEGTVSKRTTMGQ
ncbi:MAG: hypothetical protein QGI56_14270, partial [Dehalococcoidia bacterium]|nr:hypothetical protein [Dehalococcoidia bacterium]